MTALTAPIAGFLGASLKAASDQQTALAQLNAVIKSTGGIAGVTARAADDLANSLSKVTRFSDDSILSAENMLLTFTSIGRDIFPDVTKATLDLSTAMGQDLKSSAIQLGKALNSPVEGVSALRRVGVQFTDAQEEMIKKLVESGNLLGAQTLILKEVQKEFGGSAEAAGKTFAGSLDIVKNKVEQLSEKVGFFLMPTISKFVDVAGNVIDRVTDWADKNPELVRTIVNIAAALVATGPALIGLGTVIKLVTDESGPLSLALTALASPIGLIVLAIGLLAVAFATNFGGIRDKLAPLLKTLGEGFATIGRDVGLFISRLKEGGLGEALGGLFGKFEDGSSTIKNLLESFGMAEGPASAIADAVNTVYQAFKKLGDFLGQFWALIRPGLEQLANWFVGSVLPSVVNFIGTTVIPAIGKLIGILSSIWDVVSPYLLKLAAWFTTTAVPAIITFVNGFVVNLNDLVFKAAYYFGTIKDTITKAFTDAAQFIQDKFITPLQQIGVLIGIWLQPVVDWFQVNIPRAISTVQTVLKDVQTFLENLWTTVKPLVDPIITWFKDAAQKISDFFTPVFTTIQNVVSKALAAIAIVGKLTGADNSSNGGFVGLLTGATGGGGDTGPTALEQLIADITGRTGVSNPIAASAGDIGAIIGTAIHGVIETVGGSGTPFHNMGTAYGSYGGYQGGTHDFRGPYSANTPYLIGRGAQPEVFIPSSSGIAVPNADRLGGGGRRFTWNGDLNVPPNSSINVNREQVYSWMDSWAEEVGIYG